ncbi:MAG: TIGR03067 domain-containing protein [Gemmataceae bacterium]
MRAVLAALAAVVVASPPAAADAGKLKEWTPAAKAELKRLGGSWEVVKSVGTGGEKEAADSGVRFTFKGTEVALSAGGKKETFRVAAIDPTTDPKCIDLIETRQDKTVRVLEAVYRIDGDTLKLAFHVPEGGAKDRPTSFEKPANPRTLVWTFRRVKE